MGYNPEIYQLAEYKSIQEIVREERYSLRNEKKRPWSIKTRRPFSGKIDKAEMTFRKSIELAEKVACELGSPVEIFSMGKRGRPPFTIE